MVRKVAFACLVVVLILAGSITPAAATPPVVKLPSHHPSGGQAPVVPTMPFSINQEYRKFITVMSPVQSGFTTAGTFFINLASFKNHLVASVVDWMGGLRIVASPDGINWAAITPPGLGINPCYWFSYDFMVFKGQLYMPLHDWGACGLPGLVVRTSNGKDWEIVLQDTPTHDLFGTSEPHKMGVFNGMIYLANNSMGDVPGQIWRSPSGDPGTWTLVNAAVESGVYWFSELVSFKGYVYVGGADTFSGPFVLRSADGLTWDKVTDNLVNDPGNSMIYSLVVYKDQVYLSTNNWYAADYPGGRILRSKNGLNWELVVSNGFENPALPWIQNMIVYQNKIIATVASGSDPITYVYASGTGNPGSWVLVNQNGIGPDSYADSDAVFKGELYFGTGFGAPEDVRVIKMVKP